MIDRQLGLLRKLEKCPADTEEIRKELGLSDGSHVYRYLQRSLDEGLIQRIGRERKSREPGRPVHCYELTEKGRRELDMQRHLEQLRQLQEKYRDREIGWPEYKTQRLKIPIPLPTVDESRKRMLEDVVSYLEHIANNKMRVGFTPEFLVPGPAIVIIDTEGRGSYHVLSKELHTLRTKGKGTNTTYIIEPKVEPVESKAE